MCKYLDIFIKQFYNYNTASGSLATYLSRPARGGGENTQGPEVARRALLQHFTLTTDDFTLAKAQTMQAKFTHLLMIFVYFYILTVPSTNPQTLSRAAPFS